MASRVKVVSTDFRQTEIKVTPMTQLTEVLEQACAKLKVDPTRYSLKHKQRQIDLSNTFRTSGLVQGAKLELVLRSNTPTAINVALQLPAPEAASFPPHGRLTQKLSSDTTLWKVMRYFESTAASAANVNLNITARGVARLDNGPSASGGGQLYYETPVLHFAASNRRYSTFLDFQKTLSQLGYNSSGVLVRLSFDKTDQTFVDAVAEIDRFFKEEEAGAQSQQQSSVSSSDPAPPAEPALVPQPKPDDTPTTLIDTPAGTEVPTQAPADAPQQADGGAGAGPSGPGPEDAMDIDGSGHSVRVFAPPSADRPAAASRADAEDSFNPSTEHARAHQRLLATQGQNRRLPSDRELADRAAEQQRRLLDTSQIRVRLRLPDNSMLETTVGQNDTGATLYALVRASMAHPEAPFRITTSPAREVIEDADASSSAASATPASPAMTPSAAKKDHRLILGYGFRGNVLLNLVWTDQASPEARRPPFLKQSAAARARQVDVPQVPDLPDDGPEPAAAASAGLKPSAAASLSSSGPGASGGMKTPKWLKGFGKK